MKILDGDTYKNWHEIYTRSSDEKDKVLAILKKRIELLPSKNRFLDIGSGEGSLTFKLSNYFKNSLAVDPNPKLKEIYSRSPINFINKPFESFFSKQSFDLILCSHVFWLIKADNQQDFISKMFSYLSRRGKMFIIMAPPVGECHEFYNNFFYNYKTTTHEIIDHLHNLYLNFRVFPLKTYFQNPSFEEFTNVCKLFTIQSWLHPNIVSDDQIKNDIGDINAYTLKKVNEIKEYIRRHFYRDNLYRMEKEIEIIEVCKDEQ